MSTTNLYRRLIELLPSDAQLVGDVQDVQPTAGTATVMLPGGGTLRVRDPLGSAIGDRVFVQGSAITGPAPTLPIVLIEIF